MKVLAEDGELGLLPSSVEEALAPENQFYKHHLHGTSHMLGIDVHDCADAPSDRYPNGNLSRDGSYHRTGLYFQLDDLTVPAKYRGIGIRIEDDVL